jgi:hypothetical protein
MINKANSNSSGFVNDSINLRIRGIDYSNKIAQVWITIRNQTVAYNIKLISLDPQDDLFYVM